jgi:hypothetical protein
VITDNQTADSALCDNQKIILTVLTRLSLKKQLTKHISDDNNRPLNVKQDQLNTKIEKKNRSI